MRRLSLFYLFSVAFGMSSQVYDSRIDTLFSRAFRGELYSHSRQVILDSILMLDPGNAYAWQQKAMPLYKRKKYELGAPCLDSAVKYDPARWMPYRAFMKCIFEKSYSAALSDFRKAVAYSPTGIVMDHTFDFYSGLCYLQLNRFDSAKASISRSLQAGVARIGEGHFFEYFYLGIVLAEMGEHHEAIRTFDKALNGYGRFSDVKYYKALSLARIGRKDESQKLLREALSDLVAGYTISEDSVIYEEFPYQLRKEWIDSRLRKAVASQ